MNSLSTTVSHSMLRRLCLKPATKEDSSSQLCMSSIINYIIPNMIS